ncbi:MAG TPA: MoaD/ThiS family protein [Chthonomonadales bacterium]|nr:MoaD/ThiS family protein [Chthonomonadales bacterium]
MPDVEVTVTIPALLADCTGGQSTFTLEAATLAGALERMRQTYPLLRLHLYEESGRLRQHVVIFYNGENSRRLDQQETSLQPGDRIEVLQAVSGG